MPKKQKNFIFSLERAVFTSQKNYLEMETFKLAKSTPVTTNDESRSERGKENDSNDEKLRSPSSGYKNVH
jgi:hypothetical protein